MAEAGSHYALMGWVVSRGMSRGSCGLFSPQAASLLMGPEFSPNWLFALRHPRAVSSPGRGEALLPQQRPPGELKRMEVPRVCPPPCPHPTVSHSHLLPPGGPPRPAGRSGPGSRQGTAFALRPVCGLQEWHLRFPLGRLRLGPAGLQSRCSAGGGGGLLLPLSDPHAGQPDLGLRALTPVGELPR